MDIKHRVDLNKLLPSNPVTAEIGVAEGQFSNHIIRNWKPSKHYMVDLWESRAEFFGDAGFKQEWHNKNYQKVKKISEQFKQCEILRGPSIGMHQYVGDESLDFFHLDACHSFDCVINDLNAWVPKLKFGGIASGHDFLNPEYGVKEAVYTYCIKHGFEVKTLPENKSEDACWMFVRVKRNN